MTSPFRVPFVAALPVATSLLVLATAGSACDVCSLPTAPDHGAGGFSIGLHEQFSHLGTVRDEGVKVANDEDQYLDSSQTQLALGYRFLPWLAAQVVVPYLHRTFRRPDGFETDQGSESGLGDITALATARFYERDLGDADSLLRCDGSLGLKLPTGSSTRLAEEQNEVEIPGAPESVVHGHDLALGSGSWDVPVALDALVRWRRWYGTAHVQYTFRTTGDYDYTYADDVAWSVTPGFDAWRDGSSRLGLEVNATGEAKGKDHANGETQEDTGIVAIYLGPQVSFAWDGRLLADLGLDLPVYQDNTAAQIVTDYRIHGSLGWAF